MERSAGSIAEPRGGGPGPLLVLGLAGLGGWCWLALGLDAAGGRRDVWAFLIVSWALYAVAWGAWVLGRRRRSALPVILAFAAVFRLVMLAAGLAPGVSWADLRDDLSGRAVTYDPFLLYDNDVWRYLWDGHLQAHGFDPYRLAPRDAAERAEAGDPQFEALFEPALWWDVYDNVAFRSYRSVYPPLAQHLFRALHAVAPGSVLALKAVLAACDLLACVLLVRLLARCNQPPAVVALYAWNPLVIKEIAGSGHVDALLIVLVLWALLSLLEGRPATALVAAALSVSAKLASGALLGLFLLRTPRRLWWLVPAVGLAVSLPYLSSLPAMLGALAVFAREWQLNAGAWAALRWLAAAAGATEPELWAHAAGKGLTVAAVVAATAWAWRAPPDDAGRRLIAAAFWMLAATALLNAAVMPWYLLWALPPALATGNRSWWLLTALALLSYLIYAEQREATWWLLLEHGGFAVAVAVELALARRRGKPPRPGAGDQPSMAQGSAYQRLPPP
ncbi:MAG: hypothetical protein D6696_10400 [Acidobacteria bacterium]|nr:MAG: hypothetical protein D6696_10400 [Acidobacteriota bacterium]